MVGYNFSRKTIFYIVVFSLALCLLPQAVFAASVYPIEKDGALYEHVIGYGYSIDNTIYVPLRLLFEATEAEVNWDSANDTIIINRCDGAALILRPGSRNAQIVSNSFEQQVTMNSPALMLNGATYVPIRFAAENLLCSLTWDNAAKKVLLQKQFATMGNETNKLCYVLDFANGKLYERNENKNVTFLGQSSDITDCYKREFGSGWDKMWFEPDVLNIDNGCLLMDMSLDTTDSQMWTFWRLLIAPDSNNNRSFVCKTHSTLDNLYHFYFDGVHIWWPEETQVWQLNAKTGETIAVYDYQDLLAALPAAQNYGFSFSDGEYMLLTYQKAETYYSNFPILVNLRTGELQDVFASLIPADEQKDFCFDGASPGSSLKFVRAENGTLYFVYQKIVYGEHNFAWQEQELAYKYK